MSDLPDNDSSQDTTNPWSGRRLVAETRGKNSTFPQGCQFSPDGLCVLTSMGNQLMLFNTQTPSNKPWEPALMCESGDSVRSYTWYPHMNSADPSTCCFLAVARDQPAHLYDAYTGSIRASYRPYNELDEMESPSTLCFANNGQQLVTGGFRTQRMLQVFDLNRPGRDAASILKLGKTRRSKDGQKGLVSALACTSHNLIAVGTYSPGSIYLYDLREQRHQVAEIVDTGTCVVGHGTSNSRKRKHFADPDDDVLNFSAAKVQWYQSRTRTGVTQVEFSEDNHYLFSSSRRSNAVLQWDLRRLSSSSCCPGLASFETDNDTNQRLEFAHCGEHLWIGSRDSCVRVFETAKPGKLSFKVDDFADAVNGVSLTTLGGKPYLATASGTRHFPTLEDWDKDEPTSTLERSENGRLQLFDASIPE